MDLLLDFAGCNKLIQGWTRFMLSQLHQETVDENGDSIITKLFNFNQNIVQRCECASHATECTTANTVVLNYPPSPASGDGTPKITFAEILQKSMCVHNQIIARCDACGMDTNTAETRT